MSTAGSTVRSATAGAGTVSPFAPGAPRPPFIVLKGFPDDGRVQVFAMGLDRPPMLHMPGNAHFLPLPGQRLPGPEIHFGSDRLAIQMQLPRVPCINGMADPDVHGKALGQAALFMQQMRAPCLNHPAAVLRNGRDSTARLLEDIPGLQVPLTVKVNVRLRAELWRAIEDAGLAWPVLVRLAGSQGATGTVRLDSPLDHEALNPLPWGGRDIYITQYVDYADADGRYRNLRLAVVGQEVLPCLRVETGHWLLRPQDVPDAASGREQQWMNSFAADVLPGLQVRLMQMAARLKLDCFAVDASLRPDGSLLLFEANACNPTQRDMRRAPKLVDAMRRLLAAPATWYGQPGVF